MPDDDNIPMGRPVSQSDALFLEIGREAFKNSASSMADALNRLLPINTAVIAAGVVALRRPEYPFWWTFIAVSLVVLSLACTLCGLYPRSHTARLNVPAEVRAVEEGVIRWRGRWLLAASVLLILGVVCAVIGLAVTHH